jgi:hypothetical protein
VTCDGKGKLTVSGGGSGKVTATIDGSGGGARATRSVSSGSHTLKVTDTGGSPSLSWSDSMGNCA